MNRYEPVQKAGYCAPAACCLSRTAARVRTKRAGTSFSVLANFAIGACIVPRPYFDPTSDPSFSSATLQAIELQPGASTSLRVDYSPIAGMFS